LNQNHIEEIATFQWKDFFPMIFSHREQIDDATRFGLADLYQLRGRVGRSSRRAYSYFFYPINFVFTQDAAARLKAIQEFTQLGSGFKIAMRDLELRGAGNLLGKEQSGYISKVGFDLYCKLLQENIQRLKGQEKGITITPSINLRIKAYLPVPYISDELPRMEIYKKLSQVSTLDELREVQGEINDRYGPLPLEVLNLIEITLKRSGFASFPYEVRTDNLSDRLKLDTRVPDQLHSASRFIHYAGSSSRHVAFGGRLCSDVRGVQS